MGAMADSMAAYAQPLVDMTDGSEEEMNRAFSVAKICWNLALLPAEEREAVIVEMRSSFPMDDDEFVSFRSTVIDPMIQRHQELFPALSRLGAGSFREGSAPVQAQSARPVVEEKYPGTGRNEPCPCKSGKKYKRCCGA
jgi:hypothetical protein